MNTIKLLQSIILLMDLLPYSSTAKSDIVDQLKDWLKRETSQL